MCAGVEMIVKEADLAIIEATRKATPKSGSKRVHLSIDEAKQLGTLAKEYVLIHQIPK